MNKNRKLSEATYGAKHVRPHRDPLHATKKLKPWGKRPRLSWEENDEEVEKVEAAEVKDAKQAAIAK